ncbi:MAG TPA: hypothetical protein VNH42_03460 [Mariprofundaceae bacterium]|nr:hypothetical protein [Mariprofundaceae bacterium]
MKKILLIATLLVSTAFSGPAGAAEVSKASLDRLLELSGIHEQVSQFPRLLRAGMEQARRRDMAIHGHSAMSEAEYEKLENTMVAAFAPADILRAIGKKVQHAISEQDAARMLVWYGSDLGRRIDKAEEDGSTPEAYRDMGKSAPSLLADEQRVQFARRLDRELHLTDMTMQLQVNAAVAMFMAFSTKKNQHEVANQKAFRNRISASMQRSRPKLEQAITISTLYTYRNIDMDSLEQYLGFLATPPVSRFNKALMAGMEAGMDQAIDRMARSLENLMKQRQLQKA